MLPLQYGCNIAGTITAANWISPSRRALPTTVGRVRARIVLVAGTRLNAHLFWMPHPYRQTGTETFRTHTGESLDEHVAKRSRTAGSGDHTRVVGTIGKHSTGALAGKRSEHSELCTDTRTAGSRRLYAGAGAVQFSPFRRCKFLPVRFRRPPELAVRLAFPVRSVTAWCRTSTRISP